MRPIRIYLLILVLGAMLPGAVLTAVLVGRAFINNRASSERRLLESARVDASALDREFDRAISILDALATSPNLDSTDLEPFYREGRRVQSTQPGWYTIMLLSPDGQQLVSTREAWGTPLPRAHESATLDRVSTSREAVVGLIHPARGEGAKHVFPIRVPVIRENAVKYVLSASVDVDSLARLVPRQTPNSEEWTRTVLDSGGTIAVRTRGGQDYVGTPAQEGFRARIRHTAESVSSETTRDDQRVYAAFSRSVHGWTAVVVVPRGVLDSPLRASMGGVLLGGALLMLSGLAVALLLSRRLSADLASATLAAEAVAEGRPLPVGRAHVAETQRLQKSLADAASLLDKRARERDDEVARADAARRDAEEANRTKDNFLAVLGHELRNPLAPALTALELMKLRDAEVFKREREVLERQVAHMVRLVNDLLDVSRLARGKVQLDRRRVELREADDRAIDMARPLIQQHQHRLDISVPASGLPIDADVDRIVQVLSNLLTNAAKYTPPGGHISLAASIEGNQVVISCEDDGPGVPPELAPRLFDPFAQGPRALDRREGGLGLGLALARTFTELHGGTIRVEPRARDTGSRFVIALPQAAPVEAAQLAESLVSAGEVSPRRILLVDDNLDACGMLREWLQSVGHTVKTAVNGPDAIAIASDFGPEVAILDIGLPGMSGYELAAHLRALYPSMRLIALTGYGQAADMAAAESAGFDAHCVKPIPIAMLLDTIQSP